MNFYDGIIVFFECDLSNFESKTIK